MTWLHEMRRRLAAPKEYRMLAPADGLVHLVPKERQTNVAREKTVCGTMTRPFWQGVMSVIAGGECARCWKSVPNY